MNKVMKKLTVIIDRGHATLDAYGKYSTAGKQFKFPDGLHVYEGYENQKYAEAIARIATEYGMNVVYTVKPNDPQDISLVARVKFANALSEKKDSMYLSIHNNAGKGKGTEIFTSVGFTKSDIYADEIILAIKDAHPNRVIRTNRKDFLTKEENFYVLKNTSMPAVLVEYGFFDNREDYEWLSNPCNIETLAEATIKGIKAGAMKNYGVKYFNFLK